VEKRSWITRLLALSEGWRSWKHSSSSERYPKGKIFLAMLPKRITTYMLDNKYIDIADFQAKKKKKKKEIASYLKYNLYIYMSLICSRFSIS
jgi:hypothetical protein